MANLMVRLFCLTLSGFDECKASKCYMSTKKFILTEVFEFKTLFLLQVTLNSILSTFIFGDGEGLYFYFVVIILDNETLKLKIQYLGT